MKALSKFEGVPLSTTGVQREVEVIAGFAANRPQHTALMLGTSCVTYAELEGQVSTCQRLFAAEGLKPGDRLAYIGANNPIFISVMLASMRAGLVLVPVNWRLKVREIAYQLADCEAQLILADTAFLDVTRQASGEDIMLWCIDGADAADLPARISAASGPSEPICGDWATASLMLYTSGTTGDPKGVQISEQALALARQMERDQGGFDDWGDDEVLLSPLPLFHIGGISWALCGLNRGATVVFTTDVTATGLLDLSLSKSVTRTFMVPQLVRGLIDEMIGRNVRVPSLKGIHYGAAPMDPPLLQRGLEEIGCKFLQYFGMTEMSGTISILSPDEHDLARPSLLASVGRVVPGSAIEIREPDGRVTPLGEAGEIWTRGPTMMLGYAGKPELTAEAIVDGWYRTGDGGRMDRDGFLYLTDRIKDMIVTGGENVYPAEVESVLREHPAVSDCAVFGRPDTQWGERVCVAIEVRTGRSVTEDEVIAHLKSQIAGFKVPREVHIVAALPRTASGKVQRGKVRQMALEMV